VPPKRRRARFGVALCAVLAILALFVLDGAAAGVASLAAMLAFIGTCIYVLGGEDADTRARSDRTGLAGWLGHWF
jgi:hypothetical protein